MKFNSSLSTLGVCSWCVQWVSLPCASRTLSPFPEFFPWPRLGIAESLSCGVLYLGNPHPSRIYFPSCPVPRVPVSVLSVGYLHSRALMCSEMGLDANTAGSTHRDLSLLFMLLTFHPCDRFQEPTHQPLHRLRDPQQPPGALDPS